jgi:hypothetical protein
VLKIGSEMLMGAHETQRMASALTFLERYHEDSDEFLRHIVRITSDETWISFLNIANERAVKAVDAHTFTKQAETA